MLIAAYELTCSRNHFCFRPPTHGDFVLLVAGEIANAVLVEEFRVVFPGQLLFPALRSAVIVVVPQEPVVLSDYVQIRLVSGRLRGNTGKFVKDDSTLTLEAYLRLFEPVHHQLVQLEGIQFS